MFGLLVDLIMSPPHYTSGVKSELVLRYLSCLSYVHKLNYYVSLLFVQIFGTEENYLWLLTVLACLLNFSALCLMRQDSLLFIAAIVSYCESVYYAVCVWSIDGDTM